MERRSVPAGTIYEDTFGYSRAVRVENTIYVSGTAATDTEGVVHGKGDIYAQALYILTKIQAALEELGASMEDVVRTRVFVTDIDAWEEVARAHGAFFGGIKPAAALIEVSRLVDPDMLIEIEADAITQ